MGVMPDFAELARRAETATSARLGWPAPVDPAEAIDEAEYDLALLNRLDRAHVDGTMAAPASAAPMAASAISSAVTGRCGDIDGVWTEPVTAEEMITFRALTRTFLRFPNARAS